MSLPRSASTPGILMPGKVLRRVDRPRPLKIGQQATNRLSAIELSSVEDVVVLMENVGRQLSVCNYERSVISGIIQLCSNLKKIGPQLENLYKDQLDKLGVFLRNACRDEQLDLVVRVHLLEIIELRAMNWQYNENVTAYYKQKLSHIEGEYGSVTPFLGQGQMDSPQVHTAPIMTGLNANAPDFNPVTPGPSLGDMGQGGNNLGVGEVLAQSGRFREPSKIVGKNYYKDEVVIRNGDSGKVMGLKGRRVHMIEELTETVISFQRVVPGARERLVQITGPAVENITEAKRLIEDTIRRNQSPMPREEERCSSPQESICSLTSHDSDSKRNTLVSGERDSQYIHQYKYTVNVGEESIRITGGSLDLVRTAKLVLDEYFSIESSSLLKTTNAQSNRDQRSGNNGNNVSNMESQRRQSIPKLAQSPSLGVVYDRTDLLKLASSVECMKPPVGLEMVSASLQALNILRKEKMDFDGLAHIQMGAVIFKVDYVKPNALEPEE